MINRVILVGRLVRDPELRSTSSGINYVRFTLAINNLTSKEKNADFIPIVAWRFSADFISKYGKKGSLIGVEGMLNSYSFKNKHDEITTKCEVTADRIQLLESKKASNENATHFVDEMTFASPTTEVPVEVESLKESQSVGINEDIPWDPDL